MAGATLCLMSLFIRYDLCLLDTIVIGIGLLQLREVDERSLCLRMEQLEMHAAHIAQVDQSHPLNGNIPHRPTNHSPLMRIYPIVRPITAL
jgi:hypothetical protein